MASTLLTNLVAYWKLNEPSGSRFDSFSTNTLGDNATVTVADGKVYRSAIFTRANSEFLNIADNAALSGSDRDFTFAGWGKFTSKPAGMMCLLAKWTTTGNQREYEVFWNNSTDRLQWHVSSAGSAESAIVTASNFGAPSLATWYFIEVFHDAANNLIGINVNNGTVNTTSYSSGVFNGTADFTMGQRSAGSFYDGELDEWGMWNKILTADERAELYNGGNANTYPFTRFAAQRHHLNQMAAA